MMQRPFLNSCIVSDTGIFSVLKFALVQKKFAPDIELHLTKNVAIDTIQLLMVR